MCSLKLHAEKILAQHQSFISHIGGFANMTEPCLMDSFSEHLLLFFKQLPAGHLPTGHLPAGHVPTGCLPAGNMFVKHIPVGHMHLTHLPAGQLV